MHNDEPTLVDLLDRQSLVQEVGEAIATCSPPQVFGVHGDWGLGKTSFLYQVQWYLTGKCPQQVPSGTERASGTQDVDGRYAATIRTVWFEAWRYQHEHAPVVALLHEMRSQLSWQHQAATTMARGVETVVRGALHSIEGITTQIGFQYSKYRDANREWEAKNLAAALPSHTLREHLSKALGQLLPLAADQTSITELPPTPRIVVFVDDLDRCEPEAAYRLLEGLKIYLTLDNCVFVLGMNQKTVEEALDIAIPPAAGELDPKAYRNYQQRPWRAAAYLEKLCQNVWRLPAVHDPGELLGEFLRQTVRTGPVLERIQAALTETRCFPRNPRRLKGLSNLIGRLSRRLPNDAASVHVHVLLIVAYVYQFHPDLYTRWQAEPSLYDKIVEWCRLGRTKVAVLGALALPAAPKADDEQNPYPQDTTESTYQDPAEPSVFWIQPLVNSLGTGVHWRDFAVYLDVEVANE